MNGHLCAKCNKQRASDGSDQHTNVRELFVWWDGAALVLLLGGAQVADGAH